MFSSADALLCFYAQLSNAAKHTVVASRATVPGPVGNAVFAIPLSKLSMTRERPIFSPSRRPPPLPAPPAVVKLPEPARPAKPEHSPLVQVGTVAGEDSGIAVFVENATENIVRLRVNESPGSEKPGCLPGSELPPGGASARISNLRPSRSVTSRPGWNEGSIPRAKKAA